MTPETLAVALLKSVATALEVFAALALWAGYRHWLRFEVAVRGRDLERASDRRLCLTGILLVVAVAATWVGFPK